MDEICYNGFLPQISLIFVKVIVNLSQENGEK